MKFISALAMKFISAFRLKRQADCVPLGLALTVGSAQLAAFVLCRDPKAAALVALVLMIPRVMVATVVHNHSHTAMFRGRWPNRIFNALLYLETGMMVAKFHLHHNCGHHRHYTDPQKDPSTWVKRNGITMTRLEYIARYFFTHTYQSIRIGKEYPVLLRRYWEEQMLVGAALLILLAINPINAIILLIIPMLAVWLTFINFTYDDHLDLHSKNDYEASYSKTNRLLNLLTFNNGYHLAHHLRPGMHWSELPRFHEGIKHRIRVPEESTVLNRIFR